MDKQINEILKKSKEIRIAPFRTKEPELVGWHIRAYYAHPKSPNHCYKYETGFVDTEDAVKYIIGFYEYYLNVVKEDFEEHINLYYFSTEDLDIDGFDLFDDRNMYSEDGYVFLVYELDILHIDENGKQTEYEWFLPE